MADDAPALVVVRIRPVAAQWLVVTLAVAVTTATVLTAVALFIQGVGELDSDISLWKEKKKKRTEGGTVRRVANPAVTDLTSLFTRDLMA